jgi:hypothetical protein
LSKIGKVMPKVLEKKLIEEFKDTEAFSRDDLYDFYKHFESDLKEGTFTWRIHDLKNKDIIRTVKRGWYTLSFKPRYEPVISSEILKLSKRIGEHFEEVEYCLWETSWLNEFLHHQSSKRMIVVEVEKGFEENLYFLLKDNFNYEVYLNPHEKEIDLYITESHKPVIINKLITKSPLSKRTEKRSNVPVPQLEKILVDLFADEKLFYFYHGSEMNILFENALRKYSVNYTRLFSYAKRRAREEQLKSYLNNNLKHVIMDIFE